MNARSSCSIVAFTLTALLAAGPAFACIGDCNQDGKVSVDELVTGVNIALGRASMDGCRAMDTDCDEQLGIDEVVAAVRSDVEGCPMPSSIIVFNGEANNLNAYDPNNNFLKQNVIRNHNQDPNGLDINAQICFFPDGSRRFIAGEDTGQPDPPQGWGIFQLEGHAVGELSATKVGKLTPTYQATDNAENYGCGFLSDGRALTGDVGNQDTGDPNGQLIVWFPPFDRPPEEQHYCKIDVAIGTAGMIYVDQQDRIYIASSRAGAAIYRYSGAFPTSDDAAGGCGRIDESAGGPLVDEGRIQKEVFIPADSNIRTPSGIARTAPCGFYVSSVFNGVIAEYDYKGRFVRRILERLPGETHPFPSTGTPFGIGLDTLGTLYYADIGIVLEPRAGPGPNAGHVRRIRFDHGVPLQPEIMDSGLNFPDGIGVLEE